MTVTEQVRNEVWVNSTPGIVFIKKNDHRGELLRIEQIDPGRRFTITSEERQLNMESAANEIQCPFRNGTFMPVGDTVRLLDADADSRELANNPNAMAESDMRALLKANYKTFESKLRQMHNLSTLDRFLALAYDEDASVKKVDRIKAHTAEVAQSLGAMRPVEARDPSKPDSTGRPTFGRPVSPR